MKMLKRTLALMLALIMMFSAVPFNAYATESTDLPSVPTEAPVDAPESEPVPSEGTEETVPEETVVETTVAEETVPEETVVEEAPMMFGLPRATTQADTFTHKIVHLDNGRKYFSADWIKALITEMAADGFTQLQLAFGNDGLRFLLDDMSVTVNGTTYSSANVTAGIQAGNKAYYDDGVNELTEAEMDEIIDHAKAKGIEIVPHLNMPGHMDAILDAIEYVGISDAHFTGRTTSVRSLNLNNATAVAFTKALLEKYVAYFEGKCSYFHIGADEFANDAYGNSMGFPSMGSALYTKFAAFVNDCAAIVKDAGMTPRAWNDGIDYGSGTYYNYLTNYSEDFDTDIQLTYWSSGWGSDYALAPASTLRSNGHSMINTNGDYYYILGVNDCFTYGTTTTHVGYNYTAAKSFTNSTFMGSTVSDPIGSMFCIWSDKPGAETETEVAKYIRPILRVMAARMDGSSSYEVDSIVAGGFNADGTLNVVVTPDPEPEVPEDVGQPDAATGIVVTAPGLTGLTVAEAAAPAIEGAAEGKVLAWNMVPATAEGNYTGEATVAVPVPADWDASKMGAFVITDGAVELLSGELNEAGLFQFTMPHFSVGGVYEVAPAAATPVEVHLEIGGNETITLNGVYYEDQTIADDYATIVVDGTAAVESTASYTKKSVSYSTLAGSNTSWTKTNYYALVDGKYYPVYAYTRDFNYYYGYSTSDSGDNVTLLHAVYYWDRNTNVEVYSKTGTEGTPASTTITITGVAPGTTSVEIGGTTYNITVHGNVDITINYVDQNGNTVKTETVSIVDNAETYALSNFNKDGKFYTVESTTLAITPATVTEYTVKVTETEEDLSKVDPMEVEFWITNQVVTINDATSMTIAASAVHSEAGVSFVNLVPASDNAAAKIKVFWKGWLLPDGYHQAIDSDGGEDMTTNENGTLIRKIRYWNRKWQYFDGTTWTDIKTTDQLVAYYMQQTEVTTEVTTNVVDWGEPFSDWKANKGETWFWDGYVENGSKYIFMDFAVVYEDGTQNPSTFPNDNTWFFHFDKHSATNPRVLKPITFVENDNYEIWKVTVTDGTSSGYTSASKFTSNYDNDTETVVWTKDMGGEPVLDDITYTANRSGKLVRVYVRTVATEDSLTVVYYDEKFGDTLYSYNINVPAGHNFTENMTVKPSTLEGGRIDVTGCGIVNTLNVTQTFETDLTKVPEAVGKYHSDLYEYTGSVISEDGKTLYLYYNINTHVLKPNFVVDFGLPITFNLSKVTNTPELVKSVTASAKYGTVSYNPSTKTFTYTPTKVLQNVDILSITLTFDGGESALSNVGVTPATTVYYEESFLSYSGDWTKPAAPSSHQTTEVLGEHTHNYGYDPIYADDLTGSNGTKASTSTNGASASFTFTGTGFELYANCNEGTGYVTVTSDGQTKKMYMVDTGLNYNDPEIDGDMPGTTTNPTGTFYNIPVISEKNLPHGTYTVTIRKTHKDDQAFEIDGVRITNTIDESAKANADSIYVKDLEDKPEFYQLRDFVLNSIGIDGADAQQVYNDISGAKAIVTTADVPYTDTTAQDLLNNGPKNELYLFSGQTLTFNVKTARKMQIGLKAPNGATTYDLKCTDVADKTNVPMNTSVDMFYELGNTRGTEKTYTVSVKNTGKNVLAVTDLKICDDPNFGFVALTEDDIAKVLGVEETPVEPEVPETTEPEVPETTEPAKPTKPTEPSKPTKPTEPTKPTKPTEPTKPSKPTKPTEPTKPSKPTKPTEPSKPTKPTEPTKPTKPTEPQKPGKPGNNGNNKPGKEEKTYTLKITFVNLLGKKVGTATITTTNGVVSAYEIVGKAPAGRMAIWLIPVTLRANGNTSIVVPVI